MVLDFALKLVSVVISALHLMNRVCTIMCLMDMQILVRVHTGDYSIESALVKLVLFTRI